MDNRDKFRIAKISAIIECIFFFLAAFAFAQEQVTSMWQGLLAIFYLPILFFSGILCLIFSFFLIKDTAYRSWAYSFIIISVLLFNPFTYLPLAQGLSYPFAQMIRGTHSFEAKVDNLRENSAKMIIYKKFMKEFASPQRIIAVKHRYVLLESNKAIDILYPCNYGIDVKRERQIENYVNKAIIEQNRLVEIRLPKMEEFMKWYKSRLLFLIFDSQDKKLGYIPALIYLDGHLVNLNFTDGLKPEIIAELAKYR